MQHFPNYLLPIHCNDWPGPILYIMKFSHSYMYIAHDIQFIPTKIIKFKQCRRRQLEVGASFSVALIKSCSPPLWTIYPPPQCPMYFCCNFQQEGLPRGSLTRRSFLGGYS